MIGDRKEWDRLMDEYRSLPPDDTARIYDAYWSLRKKNYNSNEAMKEALLLRRHDLATDAGAQEYEEIMRLQGEG